MVLSYTCPHSDRDIDHIDQKGKDDERTCGEVLVETYAVRDYQ
jgi:hypothetical protein